MDPLTCRAIPSPRENFAWLQVTTVYIFYMPPLAVTSPLAAMSVTSPAWDGDRTHTICRCAIQCSPLLPQRPHFQGICFVGKSPISRNHLRSLELRSRIPLLKNNISRLFYERKKHMDSNNPTGQWTCMHVPSKSKSARPALQLKLSPMLSSASTQSFNIPLPPESMAIGKAARWISFATPQQSPSSSAVSLSPTTLSSPRPLNPSHRQMQFGLDWKHKSRLLVESDSRRDLCFQQNSRSLLF
jgi:hypothetical protein